MNFHDNSKNKKSDIWKNWFFIRFSTLRFFHEIGIKTEERGGGLHIISWDMAKNVPSELRDISYLHCNRIWILPYNNPFQKLYQDEKVRPN